MTSYPIANMTKGASWSLCSRSAATVPLQYNLQYLPADCRLRSEQTSRQQLSSAGRRKILLSGLQTARVLLYVRANTTQRVLEDRDTCPSWEAETYMPWSHLGCSTVRCKSREVLLLRDAQHLRSGACYVVCLLTRWSYDMVTGDSRDSRQRRQPSFESDLY
ncbi:hypothetical protein WJX79_000651 [Trebouxia sp. C0005]